VSETHDAQLKILQALTRRFVLDPTLDLADVAARCALNLTGADLYALCSDAMLKAVARKAQAVDDKIAAMNAAPAPGQLYPMTPQYYLAQLATPAEISVQVAQSDFDAALRELVPSVSPGELAHYAAVQRKFASASIGARAEHSGKGKGKGKAREADEIIYTGGES